MKSSETGNFLSWNVARSCAFTEMQLKFSFCFSLFLFNILIFLFHSSLPLKSTESFLFFPNQNQQKTQIMEKISLHNHKSYFFQFSTLIFTLFTHFCSSLWPLIAKNAIFINKKLIILSFLLKFLFNNYGKSNLTKNFLSNSELKSGENKTEWNVW